MSRIEDEARKIFGARAAFYTTSDSHRDTAVLARLVELARARPDWLALDIATGTGHTAFAVANHVRAVIGTDLTPEMLREAVQLQAGAGLRNVTFTLADVHALPFATGAFDLVTSRRAPHHFSRISDALAEIRRVLRPGGRVVIDDRSVPEDDFVDACLNQLDVFHDPSHVREYRATEWRRMLEAGGFTVDVLETYTKHRPLTAFTGKASPENARKIDALVAGLTPAERAALHLVEVDGVPHLNHWYCTIAATR